MSNVPYTDEQSEIIRSTASRLSVNAFAGTGKTSTLEAFAKARPGSRMLYLAFNKSVADEAKGRFPSSVDCKTSHALAFPRFGATYKDKLGNPRPFHAKNLLRPKMNGDDALVFSSFALDAVSRFLISAQDQISIKHVQQIAVMGKGFDPEEVLKAAVRVWDAMCDANDTSMPTPHDAYLKLYHLSRPNLSKYDYLLLDEAQDTNPCLFSIFGQQSSCGKVLVGDVHQNIYTFRGAMNAMARMGDGIEQHALTASFRFGPQVAHVANALLATFKQERLKLRGLGKDGSVGAPDGSLDTAYIYRTNAGLFDAACGLIPAVSNNENLSLHFVGGVRGYAFDTIMDVWNLMERNLAEVRDPFVRSFGSFGALEEYVEAVDDLEMKARMKVVHTYTFRIPRLVERLTSLSQDSGKVAAQTIKLTTAHKSKGLEFDQVILGNDFALMMEKGSPLAPGFIPDGSEKGAMRTEEANLLYVASTRARKNLVPGKQLKEFVDWYGRQS